MRAGEESARGFFATIVGDGIPLLVSSGAALVFAGGFAVFIAATGDFLPHDMHYLGMTADQLCREHGCRVVDFMIHDRVAWGGALMSIGVLYVWLAVFPLRRGQAWAWWTMAISGAIGFITFLSYLSYGYLDSWHALGVLLLLPFFLIGIVRARGVITGHLGVTSLQSAKTLQWRNRHGLGRIVLLLGALGTALGGLSISWVGITDVFVATDLGFMQLEQQDLRIISDRLVPLIAHDRNAFGGAVFVTGLTTFLCLWKEGLPRHLWEAIALAGVISVACALGIHFIVGYTDFLHLAPAVVAGLSLVTGLALSFPPGRSISRPAAQQEA